jgi:hypothetical protein
MKKFLGWVKSAGSALMYLYKGAAFVLKTLVSLARQYPKVAGVIGGFYALAFIVAIIAKFGTISDEALGLVFSPICLVALWLTIRHYDDIEGKVGEVMDVAFTNTAATAHLIADELTGKL